MEGTQRLTLLCEESSERTMLVGEFHTKEARLRLTAGAQVQLQHTTEVTISSHPFLTSSRSQSKAKQSRGFGATLSTVTLCCAVCFACPSRKTIIDG